MNYCWLTLCKNIVNCRLQVMPSRTLRFPSTRSHLKSCRRASLCDKNRTKTLCPRCNASSTLCYTRLGLTNILGIKSDIWRILHQPYRNRKKATISAENLVIFMGLKLGPLRQRKAEDCCLLEYDSILLSSWRMKDQLDDTCYFISLIMCSTCFGH